MFKNLLLRFDLIMILEIFPKMHRQFKLLDPSYNHSAVVFLSLFLCVYQLRSDNGAGIHACMPLW